MGTGRLSWGVDYNSQYGATNQTIIFYKPHVSYSTTSSTRTETGMLEVRSWKLGSEARRCVFR